MKGCAPGLVLKWRQKATRKWSIRKFEASSSRKGFVAARVNYEDFAKMRSSQTSLWLAPSTLFKMEATRKKIQVNFTFALLHSHLRAPCVETEGFNLCNVTKKSHM